MMTNNETKVQPLGGSSLGGGCDESAIIDKSKDCKESLQEVETENSVPTESKKSWLWHCLPPIISGFFSGLTRSIFEYFIGGGN